MDVTDSITPAIQLEDGGEPATEELPCKELVYAMSMYHKCMIASHLQSMMLFLEPVMGTEASYKQVTQFVNLCAGNRMCLDPSSIDSLLIHLVSQLAKVQCLTDGSRTLVECMESGMQLYLAVETDKGHMLSLSMTDITQLINMRIMGLSGNSRRYVEYCRDVVFLSFMRICKLAVEYDHPSMAGRFTKAINVLELKLNLYGICFLTW